MQRHIYRDVLEMMSEPPASTALPSAPAQLSGQELETWLEDLESVLTPSEEGRKLGQLWLGDIDSILYPSPPGNPPPGDSRKLRQLWLEDIDSVLYPSSPPSNTAQDSKTFSQLWLDDLETILYPSSAGDSSEHNKKLDLAPQFTQLEARSPGHGERPQIFCPLAGEVDTGDILSTIDFGQSQDLFGVFPAGGPPVGGREEEEERQPGATSTSPPSSPPPSSSSNGRRGAKRRGQRGADGDCGCAKSSRGGTEQGQERQVAELTAENERLRARIDQLAAEVQEARRMLIERMVNAN
uniref:CCAAT/enhancer-binding protein beta-like isoform X2 n=1 Tax=Pristiophorus japonicus TaxID=55135 RepID=UPI00398E76F1